MPDGIQTEPLLRTRVALARDLGIAPTEQVPAIAVSSGENLRWGSIWGGLFVALVVASVMIALPAGFGINPRLFVTNGWGVTWDVISVVVGTYLGGLLTGYQGGNYHPTSAGLNGLVLGTFVVGLLVLTALGYNSLSLGLHRTAVAALPAGSATGNAWAFIVSICAICLAGLSGGFTGETMREQRIARTNL